MLLDVQKVSKSGVPHINILDITGGIYFTQMLEKLFVLFLHSINIPWTDSEVSAVGSGLMDMILDAVRKHTLRKKRGCI